MSGFKISTESLRPEFYQVVITLTGGAGTYPTADGNDMHKPKQSFSGKAYRGDNPMAAGEYEKKEQLRASIREEIHQRLAEAKGAK